LALLMAFKTLTGGAARADIYHSFSLTNTHTLDVMTAEQLDACEISRQAGVPPVPNTHAAEPPCPPDERSSTYHWEDNKFHQIRNLGWTRKLIERKQANYYKTLVISTGSHLWRQFMYPAFISECASSGGVQDAFLPKTELTSLSGERIADWQGCDVFNTRYPIIVQNIARFLGNLRLDGQYFDGHVVFVTTPPHVPGCDSVSRPNEAPRSVPTEVAYQSQFNTREEFYYQHPRYAETVWRSAFQKWAPRLKLSILNVTHVSETRADARVPGQCGLYCVPGVPSVWAEMLLRLLEQHNFHY